MEQINTWAWMKEHTWDRQMGKTILRPQSMLHLAQGKLLCSCPVPKTWCRGSLHMGNWGQDVSRNKQIWRENDVPYVLGQEGCFWHVPISCPAPGRICTLEKWNLGSSGSEAGKKLETQESHRPEWQYQLPWTSSLWFGVPLGTQGSMSFAHLSL